MIPPTVTKAPEIQPNVLQELNWNPRIDARDALASGLPEALFTDIDFPDGSGRQGVTDYLAKPVDVAGMKTVSGNVVRTHEPKEEIGELRQPGRFGCLIGAAPAMQKVYDLIAMVARTEAAVLITGDTGTGKELVAETIQRLSRRTRESFMPLDCGAVSPDLIESELFGHERGSFTGADRLHKGYFERANRGTLFLDELTEMPIELQVRLLRVLETSTVRRVGGTEALKVSVRVIAATNRNPQEAIKAGKLRADLFYRLNVFPIHLPSLWERREDVEPLAEHFLGVLNEQDGTAKAFTPNALKRLRTHTWPGNVRELKKVVERAFIMAGEDDIDNVLVGVDQEATASELFMEVGLSIPDVDRRLILATVEHFNGNKRQAADVLKISLKTLYCKLNQYNGRS